MAGTGTKRITELTEASTIQNGDFIAVDSNARGTKKVSTDTLATSAALTAETNARAAADEQMSERMDGIEEQTALIQNPTKTLSGALCSFTDGANMPMVACTAEIVPKQSGTGTPSPSNVRPISGWESVNVYDTGKNLSENGTYDTFEPYTGTTTPVNLGRTVYGGTLDVVSGVLTVDRGFVNFDGSSDEQWDKINNAYYNRYTCYLPSDCVSTDSATADGLSMNWIQATAVSGDCRGFIITNKRINIYLPLNDSNFTSVESLRAYLSSNNLQVVYPLAEPQTYQLTPTEVKTLLGDNNVWADSGDVEITYRRDISIVINNLESALNG